MQIKDKNYLYQSLQLIACIHFKVVYQWQMYKRIHSHIGVLIYCNKRSHAEIRLIATGTTIHTLAIHSRYFDYYIHERPNIHSQKHCKRQTSHEFKHQSVFSRFGARTPITQPVNPYWRLTTAAVISPMSHRWSSLPSMSHRLLLLKENY